MESGLSATDDHIIDDHIANDQTIDDSTTHSSIVIRIYSQSSNEPFNNTRALTSCPDISISCPEIRSVITINAWPIWASIPSAWTLFKIWLFITGLLFGLVLLYVLLIIIYCLLPDAVRAFLKFLGEIVIAEWVRLVQRWEAAEFVCCL